MAQRSSDDRDHPAERDLAQALRDPLLDWYARVARDLPWRRTRDPYAVWISEAMLQQTRVEAVEPYYARFLARFPSVEALAAAGEDDVVAAWSGLGYYRRARALRAAAREIVARHQGRFPRSLAAARALPGVGPYTAGAVLSIAYGARAALVDGNVARVLARLFAVEGRAGSPALTRRAWAIAERLLPGEDAPPGRGPGAWNQALMELGARVCAPRSPACGACPIAAACAARAAGRQHELPAPKARRATVDVRLEIALCRRGDAVLLERRPAAGRMASMWEPPTRELAAADGARAGLWPAETALALRAGALLGEVAHAITHHRIRARVVEAEPAREPRPGRRDPTAPGRAVRERASERDGAPAWIYARPDELAGLALTGLARKVLRRFAAPHPLFTLERSRAPE